MMALRKTQVIAFLFILAAGSCFITFSFAQSTGDKLADKRYVDPKGYFNIVPPAGWRVQEYPQDPRGKVAFIAPDGGDYLRILVNAVDFTSIDELVKFCKNIENRIGIPTNIQEKDFGGRPAVRRSFEAKGNKVLAYDFLVGSADQSCGLLPNLSPQPTAKGVLVPKKILSRFRCQGH